MIRVNPKICTGCRACEFACSFQRKKSFHYRFSLIRIQKDKEAEGFFVPNLCRHCADPPCAKDCPAGAIRRLESGRVAIDPQSCTGCGLCIQSCPWSVPVMGEEKIAEICDLCQGDPSCVQFCQPGALRREEAGGSGPGEQG